MSNEILDFYKKTSPYTYLGYYEKFAKKLPNDIAKLCYLQRKQILHPVQVMNLKKSNHQISPTRLVFEDDIFPTACSMINELLRLDSKYSLNRDISNKIHVTCRGQAILLASILKAKGIPTRVRSGFAFYINYDGIGYDHWITEYYSTKEKRWILVDADCCLNSINFNPFDIPRNEFSFGAEIYLALRKKELNDNEILYASCPPIHGIKAAIHGLFYDFGALMNEENIFLHLPDYIRKKNFILSEDELKELDTLATLLLDPDKNFKEIKNIWETNLEFRIRSGALN